MEKLENKATRVPGKRGHDFAIERPGGRRSDVLFGFRGEKPAQLTGAPPYRLALITLFCGWGVLGLVRPMSGRRL